MEERVKELSKYRFETSLENLEDAKLMFENGRYKNALNRAYYSIFHAIRSVNTLKGFDSSKHSGVIAFFNQSYVKEGVFDKNFQRLSSRHMITERKQIILTFISHRVKKQESRLLELKCLKKR